MDDCICVLVIKNLQYSILKSKVNYACAILKATLDMYESQNGCGTLQQNSSR